MSRNYIKGTDLFTSDRDGSSESSAKRNVYHDPLKANPVMRTAVKVKDVQYNTRTGKLEKK